MIPATDLISASDDNCCKNCRNLLETEQQFCQNCGAKIIRNRLTLKNLIEDFSERYLNLDNTFLKTFVHLITRPERVIHGYISGTRKKYVNVASYFAITLTLLGLQYFIIKRFFPEMFENGIFATEGMETFQSELMSFIGEHQALIMILYIPVYGLISKLVCYNLKQFNYTEHVVMFMYIISQTSLVSMVLLIMAGFLGIFEAISIFTIILQIIYSAYVLKRVFSLSLAGILKKTLLFFLIGGGFYLIIVMGVVAFLIFSGNMDEIIQAQQAAK